MTLSNVWLVTLADGLIRADSVIGIHTHQTPSVTGKPAHWLLDVVVPTVTGGGQQESGWMLSPLHRTLVQAAREPVDAPQQLARLLAQLDASSASGVVTSLAEPLGTGAAVEDNGEPVVRFRFTPFKASEPGRPYDPEYL